MKETNEVTTIGVSNPQKTSYQEYLHSPDWIAKRNKKRKKGKCAICSSIKRLEVHHLNYRNLYDVHQSDLRLLCHRCHELCHRLHKEDKFHFRSTDPNCRFAAIQGAVRRELRPNKGCAFTKKELLSVGVAWPPRKGWKQELNTEQLALLDAYEGLRQ